MGDKNKFLLIVLLVALSCSVQLSWASGPLDFFKKKVHRVTWNKVRSFRESEYYNTGIGVYGGLNSGVSVKHFINDQSAFEVVAGTRWKGLFAAGLYEACVLGDYSMHLMWNFGIGPRAGLYNGANYKDYLGKSLPSQEHYVIGIMGSYGLEYRFSHIPFSIALDYRPFFDFNTARKARRRR